MQTVIVVIHVIVAISIIGLVLLQQGKGADAGASFGAGASQTVFGSSGSGNFLVQTTTVLATIFFATSLTLAIFAKNQSGVGATTGLPVVNQDILEETTAANQSDIPQLEEVPASNDSQDDVTSLPGNNN